MLFAFKLIRKLNTGEVRRFWNCISSHCHFCQGRKHSQAEGRMRNMRERVIQALLVSVGDTSSQSQKYYENMKFHSKVFRASDSSNFLTLRVWPALCTVYIPCALVSLARSYRRGISIAFLNLMGLPCSILPPRPLACSLKQKQE